MCVCACACGLRESAGSFILKLGASDAFNLPSVAATPAASRVHAAGLPLMEMKVLMSPALFGQGRGVCVRASAHVSSRHPVLDQSPTPNAAMPTNVFVSFTGGKDSVLVTTLLQLQLQGGELQGAAAATALAQLPAGLRAQLPARGAQVTRLVTFAPFGAC